MAGHQGLSSRAASGRMGPGFSDQRHTHMYTHACTRQAFRGRGSFHAENGKDGQGQFKNGASGRSVEVKVR